MAKRLRAWLDHCRLSLAQWIVGDLSFAANVHVSGSLHFLGRTGRASYECDGYDSDAHRAFYRARWDKIDTTDLKGSAV